MKKLLLPLLALLLFVGCGQPNPERDIVLRVNAQVNNSYEYHEDIDLYGEKEYFADYDEFKAKGGGDCEDFAIAKFRILTEEYNIPRDSFSFVIFIDKAKTSRHLVLVYKGTAHLDITTNSTRFNRRIWIKQKFLTPDSMDLLLKTNKTNSRANEKLSF